MARTYWMNNSFSANVTNDIPNESRLEPGEWGVAEVDLSYLIAILNRHT